MTADTLANDSLKTAKNTFAQNLEENPFWKYTAMVAGILVVVAFALFTSLRKSKPVPSSSNPIGYRKHHHHHRPHPKVKL
jgi:hypothetical protein